MASNIYTINEQGVLQCKNVIVAKFKALSRHLLKMTEENLEKRQSDLKLEYELLDLS